MFLGEIDTYRGIDTYCVATVVLQALKICLTSRFRLVSEKKFNMYYGVVERLTLVREAMCFARPYNDMFRKWILYFLWGIRLDIK